MCSITRIQILSRFLLKTTKNLPVPFDVVSESELCGGTCLDFANTGGNSPKISLHIFKSPVREESG